MKKEIQTKNEARDKLKNHMKNVAVRNKPYTIESSQTNKNQKGPS